MVNNREKGSVQERKAAQFLINNGLTILEMNFSIRMGEIDIICKDNDTYVFAEVKYRKDNSHGYPYEAVTYRKQKTICRVATVYKKMKKLPDNGSYRFDVISILGDEITWYKNAFPYHG